jgi:hypothetical protein
MMNSQLVLFFVAGKREVTSRVVYNYLAKKAHRLQNKSKKQFLVLLISIFILLVAVE